MIRVGVDFGGSKIEAAALDDQGNFMARIRAANPGTYDDALRTVQSLVEQVEQQTGSQATVGVGAPGSVDPVTGVMKNGSTTYLNGRRFREDLEVALRRPVRLANDANCLALSESADGAGRSARSVFAIILGTGCGGGLVIEGKLVEGATGIAGEWGHIGLPWARAEEAPGPQCWCGRHGCIETWVSGPGLSRDHRECTSMQLGADEILQFSRAGQPQATATIDRFIDRLGRSLAMVCNLFDPEVFVFGGGLSNAPELYARLPKVIARYVFEEHWRGILVPATYGDSSGVRGAARLWGLS